MKSEKGLVAALFALSFLVANGADGTWFARSGVGTGGTNWAEWSDQGNWEGETVASGSDATATLTPAAGKYIQLPSSLSLKDIVQGTVASPVVLVGDGTYDFNPYAMGAGPKNCYLYCPFDFSIMKPSDNYAGFMSGCQFCGPVGAKKSGPDPRFSGTVSFRYDLYATEAGEEREFNTFPCNISMDVGTLRFIAPHGSSVALSSRWVQTADSPFLKLADGETPHVLSAGTTVTGDGVPEGAFLKRVFPDGSIELSAAPTTSAAANTLTFAAFNAKTYAKLPSDKRIAYYNGTGQRVICVQKYRDEDDFTVRIPYFQILYAGAANNQRYYRFSTEEGFLPGKVEFGYVHANYNPVVYLEDCHLEIYGDTETSGKVAIRMDNAAHTARLTVKSGMSHSFGCLDNLKGTLVKDGEGTLVMSVTNNTAAKITGSIVVEEGAFAPAFMDAGTNVIASLTVKSGARFVIPEGVVLKPASLSVEEGAIFGGAGRLVYPLSSSELFGIVLEDGVSVDDGRSGSDFSIEVLRGMPSSAAQDGDSVWLFDTNALLRVNGTGVFDVLVVGGGGGGGAKNGGGGGGGGVIYTQQMVIACGVYPVFVGMGGMGAPDKRTDNTSGGNSGVFGILAYGGGAGGTYSRKRNIPGGYTGEPFSGGSGGGGGTWYPGTVGTTPGADGVDGQGFAGGSSTNGASHFWCAGGGGGGAGAPGGYAWSNGSYLYGGNGGDGVLCEIYGSKYYGGGGGGGVTSKTAAMGENFCGGTGGGGHGGVTADTAVKSGENGEDGLGGGGGGGSGYTGDSEGGAGGNGGRGVVILRWRQPEVAENDVPESPIATGGDIHRRGGYAIHKFSADGSFALSEPTLVDVLLVGGGGGGGSRDGGGGGGGGVLIVSNAYLIAGTYAVTVGVGGASNTSPSYAAADGTDSVFSPGNDTAYGLRAYGGGGAGGDYSGSPGGSGGGGGGPYVLHSDLSRAGGAGTPGQGFAGGIGVHNYTGNINSDWPTAHGGGGGGAGAPGGDATTSAPGDGGDGVLCEFGGSPVYYGGGGGGGSSKYAYAAAEFYTSAGGLGGGGRGGSAVEPYPSTSAGENGVDGLGGGGGGSGGASDAFSIGGRGGNGVVIIRYRIRKQGLFLIVK